MGLLSGLKKSTKNIFKGVKKAITSVGKGVKKFFQSKIGKAVLIGAALYVGYGLATQGSAFFGGTTAAAGQAGTAATGVAETAAAGQAGTAATGAAETAAGAAQAAAPTTAAVSTPVTAGLPTAAPITPIQTGGTISQTLGAGGATPGLGISGGGAPLGLESSTPGFLTKAGQFVQQNPLASYGALTVGGNMISSALAPNPVDEQIRLDRERQKQNRIAGFAGGASGPVRVGNRTYG